VTGDVVDGPPRETAVQAGESDLAFIRRLALELDAAVIADGNGLRLLRRSAADAPLHRLMLGDTLRALRFMADATALPERLTVQGWDPRTQQALTAHRTTPSVFSPPLQTAAGGRVLVADAALTQAAAVTSRLEALLATRTRRPVTAFGSCAGAVPLQPGDSAAIAGVGPWASGTYTIDAVSHDFSLEEGWQTAFLASLPPPDPVRPEPVRREAPNADRDTRNPPRPDVVRQPAVPTGRPSPSRPAPPRRPGR
jgi:phage protein D